MFGSVMSSTYVPLPRMKRGSSLRLTGRPMPPRVAVSGMRRLLGGCRRLAAQLGGAVLNRLDDVHVAGAATEVAGDAEPDLRLGRVGVLVQQRLGGHDHPGRAEAALQPVLLPEALLQGMKLAVLLQPLDGQQLAAIGLDCQQRAGLDVLAVQNDRAGATVRGVTADVRPGQPERLADEVDQQQPRLDLGSARLAVDGDRDGEAFLWGDHRAPPWARAAACSSARFVSSFTIARLYSAGPRSSVTGFEASIASRAASLTLSGASGLPRRKSSAATALMLVGPALHRPMPTAATMPCSSRRSWAATPTMA